MSLLASTSDFVAVAAAGYDRTDRAAELRAQHKARKFALAAKRARELRKARAARQSAVVSRRARGGAPAVAAFSPFGQTGIGAAGGTSTGGTLLAGMDDANSFPAHAGSDSWGVLVELNVNLPDSVFRGLGELLLEGTDTNQGGQLGESLPGEVARSPLMAPLPPAVLAGGLLLVAAAGWRRMRRV